MAANAPKNPFRVGVPIQKPEDFAGRQETVQTIVDYMLDLQNVSLRGERRTGKTSLLLYLTHKELPENHITVYFDFQTVVKTDGLFTVWREIVKAIADKLRQKLDNGEVKAELFLKATEKDFAEKSFASGFTSALAEASDLKIHLLFDEFEQTNSYPEREFFYGILRSMPVRATNISYVIATRTGLAELQPGYNEFSSPFSNIFTSLTLKPFKQHEVQNLIFDYFARAELNMSLANKLCDELPFLHEVTGYHPCFLQSYCRYLCARLDMPDWPLGEAKQKALREFQENASEHFDYYWKVSSDKEKKQLRRLAMDQGIEQDSPGLDKLEKRCLIVRSYELDKNPRLFSSIFSAWIVDGKAARYTSVFKHDIFVSYAYDDNYSPPDTDTGWVTTLLKKLKVYLKQKLGRGNKYSLCMEDCASPENDFITPDITEQVENSAILLLILSPAYLSSKRCVGEYETFIAKAVENRERIFIIERDRAELPEKLRGLKLIKFWVTNESGQTCTLAVPKPNPQEIEYYQRINDVAANLADELKRLKFQEDIVHPSVFLAQVPEDLQQHRKTDQDARENSVFILVAPEDMRLARKIHENLESRGVHCMLAAPNSITGNAADIRKNLEQNLLKCSVVIVIYGNAPPIWVREQILYCRRMQWQRIKPLKLIAVLNVPSSGKQELPINLENMKIYDCPEEQMTQCLPKILEELRE